MSHVVVIAANARRVNIKVTPGTTLNDVLQQACKTFAIDSSAYALKHGKSALDLTVPFRLSRLSSGAKIDLVKREVGTTSSNLVTVALQQIEGDGSRIIDKFPSSTSIWNILRHFESLPSPINGAKVSFTERAAPNAQAGAGRLYYEMPLVQIMNRELSTFEDHQKTLSSLGFTSGTALLRIKFKLSDIPLEDALSEIEVFSPKVDKASISVQPAADSAEESSSKSTQQSLLDTPVPTEQLTNTNGLEDRKEGAMDIDTVPGQENNETAIGPGNRTISVFNPSDTNTPEAAKIEVKEEDLEMSVSQAKQYQAHLTKNTINKRLLTDAQKKEKADIEKQKRLAVASVNIRVRFPDGSAVQSKFGQADKGTDLYDFVTNLLRFPEQEFYLTLPGTTQTTIPREPKLIILELGITGASIINFYWKDSVDQSIRKQDPLADQYRHLAQKIPVPGPPAVMIDDDEPTKPLKSSGSGSGGSRGGGGVPKWLKFGGKK